MDKTKRMLVILAGIIIILVTGLTWAGAEIGQPGATTLAVQPNVGDYVYNELIVKFKPGVDETRVHTKFKTKVIKKNTKLKTTRVKIDQNSKLQDVMLQIKNDAAVEYVQPNYYYQLDFIPNDTSYASQWALPKISAPQAWDITKGSTSVVIAIVDTGVDTTHPDLAANLVAGYNSITNTTSTDDDNGHGTHVAGIAAGIIDNGTGIAGLAGGSKIMPVKAMGTTGSGTDADIAEGIIWAVDNGAKIINLSLGMPTYSQQMKAAVDYAYNSGVIVVAAAGNSNTSALHYPAAYPKAVAVAATTSTDAKASFSNYGTHIDLSAPGDTILSTKFDGTYEYRNGTSMAAPYVSGLAALILSQRPGLTPGQVEDIMERSAYDLGTVGKDSYFGYGRINAALALSTAADLTPMAVTGLKDTPDPFSPKGTNLSTISFTLAEKGFVTAKVYDSGNNLIVTLADYAAKNAGANSLTWNGKNSSGVIVADGLYTYKVDVADYAGNITQLTGTIIVDKTGPVLSGVAVSSPTYSPTGDDVDNISFNLNEDSAVSVTILNGTTVVRTIITKVLETAGAKVVPWDGRNNTGVIVDNGNYTYKIEAWDIAGNVAAPVTGTITINKGAPQVYGNSVSLANFAPKGTNTDTISYSLTEGAKIYVRIYNSSNVLVKTLLNGVSKLKGANIIAWDGKNDSGAIVPSGSYTYKIIPQDALNQNGTEISGTINVDLVVPTITLVTPATVNFAPNGINYQDISYSLSKPAKVTITLYNGSTVVKALVTNLLQASGANSIVWDGTNAAGALVDNRAYTYKIQATDVLGNTAAVVSGTIVLDKGIPVIYGNNVSLPVFAPTGTNTDTINFTLTEPGKVYLTVYDSANNPVIALINGISKLKGANSVTWNGKNSGGAIVAQGNYTYQIKAVDALNHSSVVVSGTIKIDTGKPVITLTSPNPDSFVADGITLKGIGFTLSKHAKVTVQIYNGTTLVRTLVTNVTYASGAVTIYWDGKNTAGTVVGSGTYTYKINATDLAGNTATQVTGTISKS